jgi:hypothetical protein
MSNPFIPLSEFEKDAQFPHASSRVVMEEITLPRLVDVHAGNNITIDKTDPQNPVISADEVIFPSAYVLPAASSTVMGGIVLGPTLVINPVNNEVNVNIGEGGEVVIDSYTKAQIDDRIPTKLEAESAADNIKFMTAQRTKEQITARLAEQGVAEAGSDNFGLMTAIRTKEQIDARLSDKTTAEGGANNEKLMTSLRTKQQIDARLADEPTAEAGSDDGKLMTPLGTSQRIVAMLADVGDMGTTTTNDAALVSPVLVKAHVDNRIATSVQANAISNETQLLNPKETHRLIKEYVAKQLAARTTTFNIGSTLSLGTFGEPAICMISPTDVAVVDSSTQKLQTYRFNGVTWAAVGSALTILGAGMPAITTLSTNQIAYIDSNTASLRVYAFSGTAWTLVGSGLTISGTGWPSITAVDSKNIILGHSTEQFLKQYTWSGSAWSVVSSFSPSLVLGNVALTALSPTSIAVVRTGATTGATDAVLFLLKFTSGNWWAVGNHCLISGVTQVALSALNTSEVLFTDSATNIAQVYKFDGLDWAPTGPATTQTGMGTPATAAMNNTDVVIVDSDTKLLRVIRCGYEQDSPFKLY